MSCDKIIFNNYDDSNTCLITNNEFDGKYYKNWKNSKFNQHLDNLPTSIRDLTLGHSFNQRLDNLPFSIINLTLGHNFNQPLDNLPSSIRDLTLGQCFNQPLDNLPYGIQNLTLDYYFNQNLNNLPSKIQNLTLGLSFNQSLDNLPSSLNKITFKSYLQYTEFNWKVKKIPSNLKIVDISKIPNKSHLKNEFGKFNIEIIE